MGKHSGSAGLREVAPSSVREVLAVEPVVRRVIGARTASATDVDDLVQDCMERLLVAHRRLAPEAVLPYAVVVARNLAASNARTATRQAVAAPRLHDPTEPDRPEDVLLAAEVQGAMNAALARLSDAERQGFLDYHGFGPTADEITPPARGALRVRMARTRAMLRLEYLLAYRHLELPTPQCRGVLLAISAGDTRRQRQLDGARHLLDCPTCAALSEPLDQRSVALTAIAVPGLLLTWLVRQARLYPVKFILVAAAVTVGFATVTTAVVLGSRSAAVPALAHHTAPHSAAASRPAAPASCPLEIGGHPVSANSARHSLRSLIGEHAETSGVAVVAAVTHNGFWIGSQRARIWVQLVGPPRAMRFRARDRVSFRGIVAANSPSFMTQAGLDDGDGKRILARQGAHLAISTTGITVRHQSRPVPQAC